jgi:co-chaperonin GroES (HSP10)
MEINQGRILPTKILVREIKKETEEVRPSGIITVSTQKNVPTNGIVLLTGEGTPTLKMPVKEGDTVLFTPLSGQRFSLNGEDLILLETSVILFIVPK